MIRPLLVRPGRCLLASLFLCLILLGLESGAAVPVTCFGMVEETMENPAGFGNPFTETELRLEVQAPPERKPLPAFTWYGFHDGDGKGGQDGAVWKFRLHFDQPGTWKVKAGFFVPGTDQSNGPTETFEYEVSAVAAPGDRGHVHVDPANWRRLVFRDGSPWVPFPIHGSMLLEQTPENVTRWLTEHQKLGVNAMTVRFHAEAKSSGAGLESFWHFLKEDGTRYTEWLAPNRNRDVGFDYERFDVATWQRNERVLKEARELGVYLSIWFGVSGDNRQYWSYGPQDWVKDGVLGPKQKLFIRYFLARWAALDVWWHWTMDSEYEEGPGDDLARDRAWAAAFKEQNPWPTLVTTHVLDWTPKDAPEYDLATLQERVPVDEARVVAASIAFIEDNDGYGIPVYNAEGVWMLPSAEAARVSTMAHLFAGGFSHIAHDGGNHNQSSWGANWAEVNPRHKQDAAMLGGLTRFFNDRRKLEVNALSPAHHLVSLSGGRHALCLAAPGKQYAVWLDEGGAVTLDLRQEAGDFSVVRYDGGRLDEAPVDLGFVSGGALQALPAPSSSGFTRDSLYVLNAGDRRLAVIQPGKGSVWQAGGKAVVRWDAPSGGKGVGVELSLDEGVTWQVLHRGGAEERSAVVSVPEDAAGGALVRVVDLAEPGGSATGVAFMIDAEGDRTAPILEINSPGEGLITGPAPTFAGTALDPSGISRIEYRLAGSEWREVAGGVSWAFDFEALEDGVHAVDVRATDGAIPPNVSEVARRRITVDAVAPSITGRGVEVTDRQAFVFWKTDERATSRVQYGTSPGVYDNDTGVVGTGRTGHRVPLHGLRPSMTYHYMILTEDPFGNLTVSDEGKFQTAPAR